jgi:hypothetical protein
VKYVPPLASRMSDSNPLLCHGSKSLRHRKASISGRALGGKSRRTRQAAGFAWQGLNKETECKKKAAIWRPFKLRTPGRTGAGAINNEAARLIFDRDQ